MISWKHCAYLSIMTQYQPKPRHKYRLKTKHVYCVAESSPRIKAIACGTQTAVHERTIDDNFSLGIYFLSVYIQRVHNEGVSMKC